MSRRCRRLSRAGAVGLVFLTLTALAVATAGAAQSRSFRDEFRETSYAGSDGSLPWSGPWEEIGESDGPTAGNFSIGPSESCARGKCLTMLARAGFVDTGVQRKAYLDNPSSVTLELDYRRVLNDNHRSKSDSTPAKLVVYRSLDGGILLPLGSMVLNDTDNEVKHAVYPVPASTGELAIIFLGVRDGDAAEVFIDNVDLIVEYETAVTTTTTPTTTTTTPPPTTTTTTTPPPTTTTTTTTPPTTTTTTTPPPTTTTTTTPPATTTTTTTTTTTPPPPPKAMVGPRPPNDGYDTVEHYTGKEDLLITGGGALLPMPGDENYRTASPLTGLGAAITTVGRSARSLAPAAIILGLLIAVLAIRGLEGPGPSRRRESPTPAG